MRKIILLTLIASLGVLNVASSAVALSPGSPWAEIRSTPDVIPEAPMIFFGAHGVSVLDVCMRGDRLLAVTSDGVASEIPLGSTSRSQDIRVNRVVVVDGEHSYRQYLFTKHFDIPACG